LATKLTLDDRLIEQARQAGGHRTKKDAVTAALQDYVRRKEQQKIFDLAGTVDFNPAWNYKAVRHRKGIIRAG